MLLLEKRRLDSLLENFSGTNSNSVLNQRCRDCTFFNDNNDVFNDDNDLLCAVAPTTAREFGPNAQNDCTHFQQIPSNIALALDQRESPIEWEIPDYLSSQVLVNGNELRIIREEIRGLRGQIIGATEQLINVEAQIVEIVEFLQEETYKDLFNRILEAELKAEQKRPKFFFGFCFGCLVVVLLLLAGGTVLFKQNEQQSQTHQELMGIHQESAQPLRQLHLRQKLTQPHH